MSIGIAHDSTQTRNEFELVLITILNKLRMNVWNVIEKIRIIYFSL